MRLLCHMWTDSKNQCSVTSDPKELRAVLKLNPSKFRLVFAQIQWAGDPLLVERKGKYISRRLQRVKREQVAYRKHRAEAGRKGGLSTQAKLKVGFTDASIPLQAKSSPSSSSSSSPSKGEGDPPPRPPAKDVNDHVARLVILAIKTTHLTNAPPTVRATLDGLVRRFGPAAVEKWLMKGSSQGKDVFEMKDEMKKEFVSQAALEGDRKKRDKAKNPCKICGGKNLIEKFQLIDGEKHAYMDPCPCQNKPAPAE